MSNDLNFYINGEWVQSDSNELIDVINPANEEVIGQVTAGNTDDIDMAVNAASDAFKTFSKTSKEERIELLKKIIEEYEKTKKIPRIKHSEISVKNEYPIPGMSHYIRYLYLQNNLK